MRDPVALVERLERHYGKPRAEIPKGPFQMALWESVAYLLGDELRAEAFAALGRVTGFTPKGILGAKPKALLEVARLGGMRPEERVEKFRTAAKVALADFPKGDAELLTRPAPAVKRVLKKFPGIGDPGADKILLFCGVEDVPSFDSNGLRVLARAGVIQEQKSYAATYKSAQAALRASARGEDAAFLRRAYLTTRRHGQELCKRTAPLCAKCPVRSDCPSVGVSAERG